MAEQQDNPFILDMTMPQAIVDAPASDVSDALIGFVLADRYEIIEKLGSGGMGAVYRARHIHIGKPLAIKILRAEGSSQAAKRFEVEAQTASTLTHPNLTVVHDFGFTAQSQPYIVMDLIEGTTLDRVIKQKQSLSADLAVGILLQVCDGLEYAHGKGIVHRDLKPSNIMLPLDAVKEGGSLQPGAVKIVDFGIAKLASEEGQDLTKTGEICGSPFYMSPEQSLGQKIDARSDIYSLGCLMYEALTGQLPFRGENAMQTLMKHVLEDPPPFKTVAPELTFPAGLEAIVFQALQRSPEQRYQNISDLKSDLGHVAAGRKPKAKKPHRGAKNALATKSVALLIAVVLAACAVRWWNVLNYGTGYAISQIAGIGNSASAAENVTREWIQYAEHRNRRQFELGLQQGLLNRQVNDPIGTHETLMLRAHMLSSWTENTVSPLLARKLYAECYNWFLTEGLRQLNLAQDAAKGANIAAQQQFATAAERVFEDAFQCATQAFPETDPRIRMALRHTIQAELLQKKNAEAEEHLRTMLQVIERDPNARPEEKQNLRDWFDQYSQKYR